MNNMYEEEFYEDEIPERMNQRFQHGNNSCATGCFGTIGLIISIFWLLNLGCGVVEIPDCLPIIGHLDEVFFTIIFLASLSAFGIEIPLLNRLASRNGNYMN
jgi:hypothetical protein